MAVHLSKPPKPLRLVRKEGSVRGVRWRSAEERREAKRKIETIRRKAEEERLQLGLRLDAAVLKSPKTVVGLLMLLLFVGAGLTLAIRNPSKTILQKTTPLNQLRARRSVATVAKAMALFRIHTGSWPQQRLGLFALAKNYHVPGWKGPYINWAYKDPWGTPYVYRMPTSPFEAPVLFSCGPDGLPDTNDDIRAVETDFACGEGDWHWPPEPEIPAADQPE